MTLNGRTLNRVRPLSRMNQPIDIETLAAHEAGHALMRWLLRGQATLTWIDYETGHGLSEAGGRVAPVIVDRLLINLAGIAVETGYGIARPTWETSGPFDDIDDTRNFIKGLWGQLSTKYKTEKECFDALFDCACAILYPHMDLIHDIADALLKKKRVTPAALKRLCKMHDAEPMTPHLYTLSIPIDILGVV